jgi:hypothetical protein
LESANSDLENKKKLLPPIAEKLKKLTSALVQAKETAASATNEKETTKNSTLQASE